MQKQMFAVLFMLILLCGCGRQEREHSNKDAANSLQVLDTTEEDEKEIPKATVTEYSLPEEVAALEELDFIGMGFYADKEYSICNSNHLNFGSLTSDGEGNIYFTDFAENAIFMCGPEGENKELLYEGSGDYLYVSSGYLYFGGIEPEDKYIDSFIRVDCNTKETEILYEEACGEVRILRDAVYLLTPGFSCMKLEEDNREVVGLSEIEYAFLNTDGRYLFYNMANDVDSLFERGYLLAWDTETETNYFVGSKKIYPLLAGNWLSYVDLWTGTRHVLDLETGADTDLGFSIQRPVSDGYKMYWCVRQEAGSFQILQWNGKEVQELCTVKVKSERYGDARLFLTEEYLYWIYEIGIREESEWGYYRLVDGKTGRLN